jgi:hypothetical protein
MPGFYHASAGGHKQLGLPADREYGGHKSIPKNPFDPYRLKETEACTSRSATLSSHST